MRIRLYDSLKFDPIARQVNDQSDRAVCDVYGHDDDGYLFAAARDMYAILRDRVQCGCSVEERLSGHLVDCWMPEVLEVLAKAEGK